MPAEPVVTSGLTVEHSTQQWQHQLLPLPRRTPWTSCLVSLWYQHHHAFPLAQPLSGFVRLKLFRPLKFEIWNLILSFTGRLNHYTVTEFGTKAFRLAVSNPLDLGVVQAVKPPLISLMASSTVDLGRQNLWEETVTTIYGSLAVVNTRLWFEGDTANYRPEGDRFHTIYVICISTYLNHPGIHSNLEAMLVEYLWRGWDCWFVIAPILHGCFQPNQSSPQYQVSSNGLNVIDLFNEVHISK